MANIEKRINKQGKVTRYRISVTEGVDRNGNPIRRRMTWTPEPGMTEKQIEKALQAAAVKFESDVMKGYRPDNHLTFAAYAEYVLQLKERTKTAARTVDRYRSMLPRINAAIGHIKLSQLRPQHLNELYENLGKIGVRIAGERAIPKPALNTVFLRAGISKAELSRRSGTGSATVRAALQGKPVMMKTAEAICAALGKQLSDLFRYQVDSTPLSNKTILEHHRFISSVLSQAEKELLVPYNAAAKATPPKAERSTPDYYQPDVLDEIIDALEDAPLKWKAIVYLLIDTGCRRGEVMGLKWSCVDLDEGILTIERALLYSPERGIYEGPPKNGHTRCVHIAPETQALLKQYREEQMRRKALMGDRWRETGFVFTRDDGRYMDPTAVTGWLAKFSDKQGLPHLHPHAFRHTAASTMIANGVDLVTTADELGHANATTTATIYAHQIATAKAKASSVRSQVFQHRKAKESGTEPSSQSA